MSYDGYATLNDMKDRLLIETADNSYNDALESAGTEASRVVDIFLKPYCTVPLTNDTTPTNNDTTISAITSDFAASIFKRRMMPEDVILKPELTPENLGQMEASGWFAAGMKKLQEYIRSYFTLAQGFSEDSAAVHNPMVYAELFKKGIITAKEAREMTAAANSIVNHIIDEICKTITIDKVETTTLVTDDTKKEYHTKKQNSFGWVQSDHDGGYEEQGD